MMRLLPPVVAALSFALLSASAGAQASVDTIAVGTPLAGTGLASAQRVRLRMSRETLREDGHYLIEGTLLEANETRAVVQRPNHAKPDTVPMFTVAQIERYAGEHSRGKMIFAGAAGGAALSLVARGMINLTDGARCEKKCDGPLLPGYAYAIPVALGAFIGSVFPAAHWVEVARPEVTVGAASHHQLQLSSSIDFR